MRSATFLLLGILLISGCKKDPPNPPGIAVLTEPARNLECTPVQSSSSTSNLVRFRWLTANDSEEYEVVVRNLTTGNTIEKVSGSTTTTIPLEKGTPYSWFVISKNTKTIETAMSETWSFYSPGIQTSHVPFPADIIAPEPGTTVFKDINNEITLQWSSSDIDEDIKSYSIFFSTENPPDLLIASPEVDQTTQKVRVISGTVYYWRLITTDMIGNTSDTGVLDFKVY